MITRILTGTVHYVAATFICLLIAGSSMAQLATPNTQLPTGDTPTLSEDEVKPQAEVSIFPNPSNTGIFTVKTDEAEAVLKTYNQAMVPVMAEITPGDRTGSYKVDISKFDDGMYFLHITTAEGQSVIQLMKR